MFQVLFVCMGNICRSPAAEGVFRHMVAADGLSHTVACDSAGTIDFHSGASPDSRAQQTGIERGYEIQGAARQIDQEDLSRFDLILAMDRENLDYVTSLDVHGRYRDKIQLFCDFVQESSNTEVPDPYYGGQAGFDKVFDLLEDGCTRLLDHIRGKLAIDG